MRKVLVTGGDGYIGHHVVKELVKKGDVVIAAVRHFPSAPVLGVEYRVQDIFDPVGMKSLLECPFDLCIHAAWENGFQHNHPSHMERVSEHFKFIEVLLETGTRHIAVLGSIHEVGYYEGEISEDTKETPTTVYGIAKCGLRNTVELHLEKNYPEVTFQWLWAYYILGDDQRNHLVFSKVLMAAQEGRAEFPFTSGGHRFDFLTIEELSRLIVAVTSQTAVAGIIEYSSGVPVSLGEKMEQFIAERGLKIRLNYGAFPEPAHESPAVWGSTEKLHAQTFPEQHQRDCSFSGWNLLVWYGLFVMLFIVVLMTMISWSFFIYGIDKSLPYSVTMRLLPRIEGVQGRYFYPILPLLLIPIHTKKNYLNFVPAGLYKICYYLLMTVYPITLLLVRYWGVGSW